MGIQTLLLIKERKKEKDICCFVIKSAKNTQKRKAIYIQILVQIHESYYILHILPIGKILSVKNARAWISMVSYLKK